MKRKLLSPDPGTEGGGPASSVPSSQPQPPPPAPPPPAPPPAATVVGNATRSEREIQLETDLETERKAKKDREVRISELEDENHRLRSVPPTTAPAAPAPEDNSGRWRPFKL